jgi:hypothetical protein
MLKFFSNYEKNLSQDLLYWCFPIGSHHDLGHHCTYVCMNSILLLFLSMTIVSRSCFSPWSSALWEFHFWFFSDDDWWWWISFVNSHFVRSKTYCCCWHCIEVMEFNTHTHTHTLGMNSNCQFVLLCNNDSITTHTRTHKIQKSFLAPNCRHGGEMLCCLFVARRFRSSRKTYLQYP